MVDSPLKNSDGSIYKLQILRDITDRKTAEERISWLASFPKLNPTPICEVDAEGGISYANPALLRLFPDLLSAGLRHHPWFRGLKSAVILALRRGRKIHLVREVRIGRRTYEQSLHPIPGSTNVIIYGRDVTKPKDVENALRASEERYRVLFEQAPDAIVLHDPETGAFVAFNDLAYKNLGYTRAEFRKLLHADVLAPGWDKYFNSHLRKTLRGGGTDLFEIKHRTKGGQIRDVRVSIGRVRINSSILIQQTWRDVTERRRIAAELKLYQVKLEEMVKERTIALSASEGRYRNLVERIPAITYISALDDTATLLYVSPQIKTILGFEPEKIMKDQRFWRELLHEVDRSRVMADLISSNVSGRHFSSEYRMRNRLGKVVWIRDEAAVIRDAAGKPLYVQGVMFDITALRHAEEIVNKQSEKLAKLVERRTAELRSANERLRQEVAERKRAQKGLGRTLERLEEMVEERTKDLQDAQEQLVQQEKLALMGHLAGSVSHELRTPLGAIKNAAYFLNMALDEQPLPEVRETLEILNREVGTSEKIIADLFSFAKPKAPSRQESNINDVITKALSYLNIPANVEVVSNLDETMPKVVIDPDQISQVVGNIVLNALQAMPHGGRLTITSRSPGPDRFEVSISDTGIGIPPGNLTKIFEPLFTTKAKGIGFGLVIAKGLVEAHGGSIDVKSEPNKGSTFTVKLPTCGGLHADSTGPGVDAPEAALTSAPEGGATGEKAEAAQMRKGGIWPGSRAS
jgi:PAS domain S-box-containing protein